MPSTEELVGAAQADEKAAFAELVRRYERVAIITAYSMVGKFHSAENVAQEAFVVAYQKLGQLHNAATFGPWLLKIVRRRALHLRRKPKAEQIPVDCTEKFMAQETDWMEPYKEIAELIARLPEHERIVTVMRYVNGCSINEIATLTGRPVGTITKQISRAIERLRNWLIKVRS